jgi:hypothetical protein
MGAGSIVGLLVLGMAGCAAAGSSSKPTESAAETVTAQGTISTPLDTSGLFDPGAEQLSVRDLCTADTGFRDIERGAQVVVADASGKTVGVGDLTVGITDGGAGGSTSVFDALCVFKFRVNDIPTGDNFYRLQGTTLEASGRFRPKS